MREKDNGMAVARLNDICFRLTGNTCMNPVHVREGATYPVTGRSLRTHLPYHVNQCKAPLRAPCTDVKTDRALRTLDQIIQHPNKL